MKKEYSYLSADKKTKIHVVCWYPENKAVGVIQIAHGMVEFIERYDRFARFLNQHGYIVIGNDHLGHGKSVTSDEQLGFFRQPGGNEAVIADMRKLHVITGKHFPLVPYFLLGHSMREIPVVLFSEILLCTVSLEKVKRILFCELISPPNSFCSISNRTASTSLRVRTVHG